MSWSSAIITHPRVAELKGLPPKICIPAQIRYHYASSLSSTDSSDSGSLLDLEEEQVAPPYTHLDDANADDAGNEIVIDTESLLLWLEDQTAQIEALDFYGSESRGRSMRRGRRRDGVCGERSASVYLKENRYPDRQPSIKSTPRSLENHTYSIQDLLSLEPNSAHCTISEVSAVSQRQNCVLSTSLLDHSDDATFSVFSLLGAEDTDDARLSENFISPTTTVDIGTGEVNELGRQAHHYPIYTDDIETRTQPSSHKSPFENDSVDLRMDTYYDILFTSSSDELEDDTTPISPIRSSFFFLNEEPSAAASRFVDVLDDGERARCTFQDCGFEYDIEEVRNHFERVHLDDLFHRDYGDEVSPAYSFGYAGRDGLQDIERDVGALTRKCRHLNGT